MPLSRFAPLLLGLGLLVVPFAMTCAQTLEADAIIPGQYLLQFQPGQQPLSLIQHVEALQPGQTAELTPLAPALGIYRLDLSPNSDSRLWLARLKTWSGLQTAQFNHKLQKRITPSDPGFALQWGMNNMGAMGGLADADIDAPEAWDISTGGLSALGDTIVIAVVDIGFDLNHNDLWFWINRSEIPGDGLDNDDNGFTDDYVGWNASDQSDSIPVDFHGTHVSGIAAALGNNGIGGSGVNWNTPVLPVFILEGDGGEIEEDDVVAAYGYIHDMRRRYDASGGTEGAFVVVTNSSFGVDYGQPVDFPIWCAMYDSLGALGILNAGATINFNDNVDSIGDIPTTCSSPYIIAVTNTTRNDELNPNAGFGAENIDLGAPGTQVYSTVPGNSGGYGSGTSMATPHVAGAIALLYAAACPQFMEDYRNDPAAMALLVRQYLLDGVTPIADLALRSVSGGRLNIYNSMVSLLDGYCSPSGLAQPQLPDASLHLYPNPLSAGGILYVEGLALLPATATANPQVWSLRDALGRPFRSGQWRSGEVLTLSLEGMTPGMYFFESAGSASPVLLLP